MILASSLQALMRTHQANQVRIFIIAYVIVQIKPLQQYESAQYQKSDIYILSPNIMIRKTTILIYLLISIIFEFVECAPVRGIWFAVSGTKAPFSKEGINQVVNKSKTIGINTIYFSVWDQSMVNFKPLKEITDKYPFIKMNPAFTFDPLQYLIEVSHQQGIKVLAWFQYGFATTYNDPTGGPIIEAKPEWAAKDQSGSIATKNNFQWMNAFHPQAQQFMIDLILSLGSSHKIDGVQGDDRLPALPSLAGYDQYTVSLYRAQHFGKQPPTDYKADQWVDWRSNILNNFMNRLSSEIRQKYPNLQIHMAPSVYPWSKYEYLQDWPSWVQKNLTDVVLPQIYRYTTAAYIDTLKSNLNLLNESQKKTFFPGVLIGVGGNTVVNAKILADCLQYNRAIGIQGQSFFYHESLNDQRVAEIISTSYSQ